MKTARDILNEMRITERPGRNGEFKTVCPQCSHLRRKKKLPCLSVKTDSLGVQYFCHHCQWQGGQYFDGRAEPRAEWRGNRTEPKPKRPLRSYYR
jgi:hypothetical protein